MLTAGKLYRVDKVMNASDVNMKYSNSKAIISVNSSASPATVVSYVYRALSEGIIHISLEGAVSDDIKYAVNEVLVDIQYNAILPKCQP